MREYETIFITRPDVQEDSRKKIVDKLTGLISKGKGEISQQDDWGVKRLAYPIRKFDKGFYTYLRYSQEDAQISEMERVLRLDENVLKFLSVIYEDKVLRPRRRLDRKTKPRDDDDDDNDRR